MFPPAALLPPLQRLPSVCLVCGAWPARPVCDDCSRRHRACSPRCPCCARRVMSDGDVCTSCCPGTGAASPAPKRLVAALGFGYPWDELIARFKFHHETAWSHAFAGLLWRDPQARGLVSGSDLLVPVPITPQRLPAGAARLQPGLGTGEGAAAAVGPAPPALADALLRIGDAPDQHALPREQRLQNLRGRFMARPERCHRLCGARVSLVGGVSTTGTTLQRTTQALLQAGVAEVHALVVARTAEQEAEPATGPPEACST